MTIVSELLNSVERDRLYLLSTERGLKIHEILDKELNSENVDTILDALAAEIIEYGIDNTGEINEFGTVIDGVIGAVNIWKWR